MKKRLFRQLIARIRHAGRIHRNEVNASPMRLMPEADRQTLEDTADLDAFESRRTEESLDFIEVVKALSRQK